MSHNDGNYLSSVEQAINTSHPTEKDTENILLEIALTNLQEDNEFSENGSQSMGFYNKMAKAIDLLFDIQTTESHRKIMDFLEMGNDTMGDGFKSNILKRLHNSTNDEQFKKEIWEKMNDAGSTRTS
jgi:hypothetical protein